MEAEDFKNFKELVRQYFADYRYSEGCSCCRNIEEHKEAENKLAELLKPEQYPDGSGWNWGKHQSHKQ